LKANDEAAQEHIDKLDTDVEVLKQELLALKVELQQRFSDPCGE